MKISWNRGGTQPTWWLCVIRMVAAWAPFSAWALFSHSAAAASGIPHKYHCAHKHVRSFPAGPEPLLLPRTHACVCRTGSPRRSTSLASRRRRGGTAPRRSAESRRLRVGPASGALWGLHEGRGILGSRTITVQCLFKVNACLIFRIIVHGSVTWSHFHSNNRCFLLRR